ncbi:group 10 secretory phospholipase A2 isoform X1 [Phyllopteryx taeniolatus]|uniref:group 10 secretory phospholipase A2 isoform X1 n=1 Tax=Phyllopteryx taeniolatus TaxID=161469 RepID=UPI002AD48FC1|nr:group 10 secretory phospholipase A2 isoform X1 [Phyllopteryx taeniolatus]
MTALRHALLLFAVTAASAASPAAFSSRRSKRGLLELAGIIRCSTGRSALAYVSYGCYCGLGGHGWPRDRADWCCHKHDCCYDGAERQGCQTKTDRYDWTCDGRTADCEAKGGEEDQIEAVFKTNEYVQPWRSEALQSQTYFKWQKAKLAIVTRLGLM